MASAEPVGWACAACTFINDAGGAQCEVCGGARLQAVQKKYSSAEFSEVAKIPIEGRGVVVLNR